MKRSVPITVITIAALAAACGRSQGDAARASTNGIDTVLPNLPPDSVFRIYVAYGQKKVSAEVAAKALVDHLQRTGQALNVEMDDDLRRAVEREIRQRGLR